MSASIAQTAAATSNTGLTSVTTKDDLDLVYQERIYEHGSNSAIKSLRKAVVVAMCVNRFKGKESEYAQLSRPALANILIAEVSPKLLHRVSMLTGADYACTARQREGEQSQQSEAPASISGIGETSSHAEIPPVTDSINSTHVYGSGINIVDVEYANHMYQHGTKSGDQRPQEGRSSEHLCCTIRKAQERIRKSQETAVA